jgi:DNA-directed RNA polymerase subunit N (RpoN/RPB10)
MIIPIRCFTCGKVLADKWVEYEKRLVTQDTSKEHKEIHECFQGRKGAVMDYLGITKICCRRHFLGVVTLIDDI